MADMGALPPKERFIVRQLRDFIDNEKNYTVALVSGVRKIGKTTALKQLERTYRGVALYVDLDAAGENFGEIFEGFLGSDATLLLLDEIQYLRDFEVISQSIYNLSNSSSHRRFKTIMTGSSAAHMTKLSISKLGGGRAKMYRLPPVTFVEYLYFTGRIADYSSYQDAGAEDFADYLRLNGLEELTLQFNDDYFDAFYKEIEAGNRQRGLSHSLVDLEAGDLSNMARLLAYRLGEGRTYDTTVEPVVGGQERHNLYGMNPPVRFARGFDLSDAMVAESAEHVKNIKAKDKARILAFMLNAGLACIEFTDTGSETDVKATGYVLEELAKCTKETQLRHLFEKVSICLTTPLFYTRLGEDILMRGGVDASYLCKGSILGKMLEVYARGASVMPSVNRTMSCVKLKHKLQEKADTDADNEVDIYDCNRELLLEVSAKNKKPSEVNVQRYFRDEYFIRVCSTRDHKIFDGVYHRIPYPVLCCMLDTGDIYNLPHTLGQTDEQRAESSHKKTKPPADGVSDIVLALIHDKNDVCVGLRVWKHETKQIQEIPLPYEYKSWNLDIARNIKRPKFCALGDFPVVKPLDGYEPFADNAQYSSSISGGWVIGEYEDKRLRLVGLNGQIKDVLQETAIPYFEKHNLSNADFDAAKGRLIGKLGRLFELIQ